MTRVAVTLLMACSVLLSAGVIYMSHPIVATMHTCDVVQTDGMFRSGNMTFEGVDLGHVSGIVKFFEWLYERAIHFLHSNKLCCCLHRKLGPILQHLRIVIHYLRPLTQRATNSLNDGFAILKNNFEGVRFYEGNPILLLTNNGGMSDDDDEEEEEEEDEYRNNTEKTCKSGNCGRNKRSTAEEVMDAVLSDNVDITLHKDAENNVAVFPHINDVIAIDSLLQNGGFSLWQDTITRKFSSAQRELNNGVRDMLSDHVSRGELDFNEQIKTIKREMMEQIETLSNTIQDINCTMIYDKNTDSVFYYDHTGTKLLDSYITRPLVTHYFKATESKLEELLDLIRLKLHSFVKEAQTSADTVRTETIEAYEEWGDTFFTEWSKYMAFRDIYEDDDEESDEIKQIYEDWFKFTTHKQEIIDFRDTLANIELDTKPVEEFVSNLELQLENIQNMYTEQLSSLKTKADTLLKARDQKEASMFKN